MLEDIKGKTCNFDVCSSCGSICCRDANPPLSQKRKRILLNYLQEQDLPAEDVFVTEAYTHPAADGQGHCIFYDKKTRKCVVHPVKPETCKAGPITFDINVKTRKIEWFLKKASTCQLAPRLQGNRPLFSEHFEAAKEEITHLICSLEAEELLAILKIPEPETVKIDENELPKTVVRKLRIA